MDANPILAETVRGNWVENRHRGAFAIIDADGIIIASAGDIERSIFPRSAIKSMQALAIFARHADTQFHHSAEELALACSSHNGEDFHVEVAAGLLGRLGLSEADLECGAHQPINAAARAALRALGAKPSTLHNACSGKHSGMLSVSLAMGEPTAGYANREHAVQQQVRASVEAVIGEPLTEAKCGTDGCSIPTYAAPLRAFARGFARMATGTGLTPEMGAAAKRLLDAATSLPHLVGGTDHADTRIMAAFNGRVMQKYGADGVQCGAIRDKGWGYALKCDDGNVLAAHAMVAGMLLKFAEPDADQRAVLETIAHQSIRSVRGDVVGEMRSVGF
ncbi:asparaginase [Devosia sp. BSSL-BM10]|uniref:Asparaginase n=1 Tax=Devosia litorisediminis TaxID=2829817 RepID=A0A942E6Y1_9HYPH|nr:asparaginase [Devosia litorisediminis]MBS3849170.1 asparaginase [Devosia litorisediminis]